jgi:hypothetical protein
MHDFESVQLLHPRELVPKSSLLGGVVLNLFDHRNLKVFDGFLMVVMQHLVFLYDLVLLLQNLLQSLDLNVEIHFDWRQVLHNDGPDQLLLDFFQLSLDVLVP